MPYPIMSTNTVTNRNTSGDRRRHTSGVTPFPILHQPPRLLDHASPTVPGSAWIGRPNSTLAFTLRRADEHLERGEPLAVAPAAAQVDQGFRKAEGEITPLTTTGTTSSPGIRRAKRSALKTSDSRLRQRLARPQGRARSCPPGT